MRRLRAQSSDGVSNDRRCERRDVQVGSATIDLSVPASFEQVRNGLEKAGYMVGETVQCPMAAEAGKQDELQQS